jgi:hypothetical protein
LSHSERENIIVLRVAEVFSYHATTVVAQGKNYPAGGFMEREKLVHDLIVDRLRGKFSKDYREIKVNPEGGPDIILASHGLTMAMVEVETEGSITPEKAGKWKEMAQSGSKLILVVPKKAKVKTTELLWKHGIADRIAVGSYEIVITMP